jgi:hypothetical protein
MDMWYKLENRQYHLLPADLLSNPPNKNDPDYIWLNSYFSDIKKKRIAWDDLPDVHVSTVFLGLDHNFGSNNGPVLYETMVFGFPSEEQERSTTWREAYNTHIRWIEKSIHRIIGDPNPYSPHSISHFIFKKEIRRVLCEDGIDKPLDFNISRLVVDDGKNQPPISFGLFNNIFYKRTLEDHDLIKYSVQWWEISDPKCDILKEVEPYIGFLKKPED